jgi:hemoglobin
VAALVIIGLLVGCESWKKDHPKNMSKAGGMQGKSLYDRLGGEPAVRAVVDDFVARASNDPKVNFTRKGVPGAEWQATPENVEKLKVRLVQFIGQATGGPQKYAGKDMKTTHKGMKITNAEFDAAAADLKASLDKLKVPAQEQSELMAIVGGTRNDMVEIK